LRNKTDAELSRRFYALNAYVAVLLLLTIAVSIFQFGAKAWQGDRQLGFILGGDRHRDGWNQSQSQGIEAACRTMNYDLIMRDQVPALETAETVHEIVGKGAKVIFVVNNCSKETLGNLSRQYPNVQFYTLDPVNGYPNVVQYGAQLVDMEYLAGMLAGLNTKSNVVGYIAPAPSPETHQYVNAFALGVQRTNPHAEVLLTWTGSFDNPAAESKAVMTLRAERADTLCYYQIGSTIPDTAQFSGMDFIASHEAYPKHSHYLGFVKVNWRAFYIDLLRNYGKQTAISRRIVRFRPIVDFELGKNLSPRQISVMETARYEAGLGKPVFIGEIYDRNGILRCSANEAIAYDSMQQMDWLVRGVRVIGN